jgi:hypothetical protein
VRANRKFAHVFGQKTALVQNRGRMGGPDCGDDGPGNLSIDSIDACMTLTFSAMPGGTPREKMPA